MRNLLIGFFIGALLVIGGSMLTARLGAASRNYPANDNATASQCISEATAATRVSFPLSSTDGVDFDHAICWPDGIEGETAAN